MKYRTEFGQFIEPQARLRLRKGACQSCWCPSRKDPDQQVRTAASEAGDRINDLSPKVKANREAVSKLTGAVTDALQEKAGCWQHTWHVGDIRSAD